MANKEKTGFFEQKSVAGLVPRIKDILRKLFPPFFGKLAVCRLPVILFMLWMTAGSAAKAQQADPFEPAINPAEAELLHNAAQLAATNIPAAVIFLQEAPETVGPAVDYALGNLYFQLNDYPKAAAAYEKAIEKLPRFRRAMANLGRVYMISGDISGVIELYRDMTRDGQADADILTILGHALMIREKHLSSENAYRQALLFEPDNEQAKIGLAKSLATQERFREAVVILKEITASRPARGDLRVILADCLMAEQKYDEALVALEYARRIGHKPVDLLATLGDLYIYRGQPEDAVIAYTEAMQTEKLSLNRILRAASGFLTLDDSENAARMLDMADSVMKNATREQRSEIFLLKAGLELRRGENEKAAAICENLLEEDPLNGKAMLMLGDIYRTAGVTDKALIQYERAGRIAGFEAAALFKQALVQVNLGKYQDAVRLLESALNFDDKPHIARYLEQVREFPDFNRQEKHRLKHQ